MPDVLHPPFETPGLEPRQLLRWLDINPVNGPLGRAQTYITLPAFSEPVTWLGYSDIVCAFNFEGPNNFSFKYILGQLKRGLLSDIPSGPNYLLCVMWVDATTNPYTVNRYAIWQGVGEVMYVPYPLYSNQEIGQNFRLEVWSVAGQSTVSQASPINFYTSKLQSIDYRYGADIALVGADAIVTSFGVNVANQVLTDYPTSIGKYIQAGANDIGLGSYPTFTTWTTHPTSFTPSTNGLSLSGSSTTNYPYYVANSGTGLQWTTNSFLRCFVYVGLANTTNATESCVSVNSGQAGFFSRTSTFRTYSGMQIMIANGTTVYTVLNYFTSQGLEVLSVYNTATGALVGTVSQIGSFNTNVTTINTSNSFTVEFCCGTNTIGYGDEIAISAWLSYKYYNIAFSAWSLPFTWPAGAVPQLNIGKNNWITGAVNAQSQ